MFFKLIRYDLKVGFSTTYKRYLTAAGLFIIIYIFFLLLVSSFNASIEPEGQIKWTLGNMLLYAFGGMQEYIPQPGVAFQFPAFWMLSYLLLAYVTLYYPFNDLEEFGQNILIRCRGRRLWWLSKCVWNISSVLCFFLLAWIIFIIGCLLSGCSLSMELSPSMSAILKLDSGRYMQFPAGDDRHEPVSNGAFPVYQTLLQLHGDGGCAIDFLLLSFPFFHWELRHAPAQRPNGGKRRQFNGRDHFFPHHHNSFRRRWRDSVPKTRYFKRRR